MKRTYFIIGAGIILSILIGFWVYSFLYGSPTNQDSFFTNLGIFSQNNSEVLPTPLPVTPEEFPAVDISNDPLRQLTTKPVIGMRMIGSSGSIFMRYVEAGTGHIYDINLSTGEENRVSNISVPVASEASVSPSGDYVAIRSGYNNQNELIFINLTNRDNPTSTILPNQVESFMFAFNNELLFTEFSLGQTEGKGYLPSTGATRRLFTAPFTAHNMAWSNSSTTNHIIFTKPAASMLGYGYEIAASGLRRLTQSGYGFSVAQSHGVRFIGQLNNGIYATEIIDRDGKTGRPPGALIPEKCTSGTKRAGTYYCSGPAEVSSVDFPDSWYKGNTVLNDYIWEIRNGGATMMVHPLQSVGRSIDITNMTLSPDEKLLYFTNKTDKTLWLYEI